MGCEAMGWRAISSIGDAFCDWRISAPDGAAASTSKVSDWVGDMIEWVVGIEEYGKRLRVSANAKLFK